MSMKNWMTSVYMESPTASKSSLFFPGSKTSLNSSRSRGSARGSGRASGQGSHSPLPDFIKPKNFSWLEEGLIAGMAYPETEDHFRYLQAKNVGLVISLTEKAPSTHVKGIEIVHIPIVDRTPPTPEQINKFLDAVNRGFDEEKGVVAHCLAGIGRTGTVLACYLISYRGLSAEEALLEVRRVRPGSVENEAQEDFVRLFEQELVGSASPSLSNSPKIACHCWPFSKKKARAV